MMLWGCVSGFALLLFAFLLHYHWSRRRLYLLASKLPGAFALPIIGNSLTFLCSEDNYLKSLNSIVEPYPSPSRIWVGPNLLVVIKEAHQLQIVMKSSKMAEKAFFYKFIANILGNGIFNSSSADAKRNRRFFEFFYSPKVVNAFSGIFQKHANILVKELEHLVDGPEFDVSHFVDSTAMYAALDVLMDTDGDNNLKDEIKTIPEKFRRMFRIFFIRIRDFWLHPDFIYKRTAMYKDEAAIKKFVDSLANKIAQLKLSEDEKMLTNCEEISKRPPSLLSLFAEMQQENPNLMTLREWFEHITTFAVSSQDSQGSALAFTCMVLGARPDIQAKVVQELREVLGSRTTIDMTDVSKLNYLTMVLKETLRLFPVGPFIFRQTTEDFKLGEEEWILPKDSTVILSIYHVHRDPKHWERPTEFYPEHFTPEAVAKRHPFAFIPFSAGPRRCIGQDYAIVSMKITLATILMNYKIEASQKVEDIKLTADLQTRPVGGYMIGIKKRTFN